MLKRAFFVWICLCSLLGGVCGFPLLKGPIWTYFTAPGFYSSGICLSPLTSVNKTILIPLIEGRNEARGIFSSRIILSAGRILVGDVVSTQGDAYGIYSPSDLSISLNPAYFLFLKLFDSSLELSGIRGKSGAYGIFAQKLRLIGRGNLLFSSLIIAEQEAVGLKIEGLELDQTSMHFSPILSTEGNAMGIYFRSRAKLENNDIFFSNDHSGRVKFDEISAHDHALGIYFPQGGEMDWKKSSGEEVLKFGKIEAQNGNALGIYSGSYLDIKISESLVNLGHIHSVQKGAYGIATSSKIKLNLQDAKLMLSLQGAQEEKAFAPFEQGEIEVNMKNSSLLLDGNGGEIERLDVSGKNSIDLSGRSFGTLNQRKTSRHLHIKHYQGLGEDLKITLYHHPKKQIADTLRIDDAQSSSSILLDLIYEPSSSSERYIGVALVDSNLIVNGMHRSTDVGISRMQEGIFSADTTLHRYDQDRMAYYYLDTSQKKTWFLNSQGMQSAFATLEGNIASYLLSLDSFHQRIEDLKKGKEGGLWGRFSFGGIDGDYGNMDMIHLQLGGDYKPPQMQSVFGVGVGFSSLLSSHSYLQEIRHFDFGVYAGIFLERGLFYTLELKAHYFKDWLSKTAIMQEGRFHQWGLGVLNELGYKIDFGQKGGFFMQPLVSANFGIFLPADYSQNSLSSQLITGAFKEIYLLDSKLGGRMGYVDRRDRFDLYFGIFYATKILWGGKMHFQSEREGERINGGIDRGWSRFLHGVQFDLGGHVEIGEYSKMRIGVDFGFGEVLHTIYKVHFAYRHRF